MLLLLYVLLESFVVIVLCCYSFILLFEGLNYVCID